jgi:hypothetical protein
MEEEEVVEGPIVTSTIAISAPKAFQMELRASFHFSLVQIIPLL